MQRSVEAGKPGGGGGRFVVVRGPRDAYQDLRWPLSPPSNSVPAGELASGRKSLAPHRQDLSQPAAGVVHITLG